MSRERQRVDYRNLNSTGERSFKDQSTVSTPTFILNQDAIATNQKVTTSNQEETFVLYETLFQDDQINLQTSESVSVANL